MERPKKINTSFLLLVLLFILTQTAYALSASVSYDGKTGNVQGNNTKEENLLIENQKTDEDNNQVAENTQTASFTDSSTTQESTSNDISTYSIEHALAPAPDINETEIVIEPELDKVIPAPLYTPEPEPQPVIKSVVKHVNADKLNVREEPTKDSKLVTSIQRGDKVTYYETVGEWARIITWTDRKGYVLAKYLVDSADKVEKPTVSRSSSSKAEVAQPQSVEGQTLADKIVAYSKTLLGVPYVWGGSTTKGFDCSGFTKYVFAKFGVSLPRSSYAYSSIGTKVSRSELQKGDILLWDIDKNGTVGHVGIYIGDGMFIHASSSKRKVVTRSLATYSEKYLGARRVLK